MPQLEKLISQILMDLGRIPMISKFGRLVMVALLVAGFAGAAQAAALQYAELTLDDCDAMGCEGSTLFLSVEEQNDGSWIVTYTINTDGYTGDRMGFNQIGWKALKDVDWDTVTVTTDFPQPAPDPDYTAGWEMVYESPISSNSLCSHTQGNTDMACVAGFVDITEPGGDYTWIFHIEAGATLITDTSEWHLGAQYANGFYRAQGKIISASAQPIPEPTAALLFGMGALLITRGARRRH
jgi:hypothetical protein